MPADAEWAKMEPHCLGKPTDPARDNRLFMEACCGLRALAVRDAICRRCSAIGARSSGASVKRIVGSVADAWDRGRTKQTCATGPLHANRAWSRPRPAAGMATRHRTPSPEARPLVETAAQDLP